MGLVFVPKTDDASMITVFLIGVNVINMAAPAIKITVSNQQLSRNHT